LTAGQPWIAINTITAGLNIAKAIQGTVKGIQQIRSANASGATAPSAGGGLAVANAAAPVATVQPTAQVATLDQASINRMGQANRAYVVESDITGSQERQARINRAARLA